MKYQLNKLKKIKYYKIKILSACHCELKIGDININLSDNGQALNCLLDAH